MYLDVIWANRASAQLQALSLAEQANAQQSNQKRGPKRIGHKIPEQPVAWQSQDTRNHRNRRFVPGE